MSEELREKVGTLVDSAIGYAVVGGVENVERIKDAIAALLHDSDERHLSTCTPYHRTGTCPHREEA